MRTGNFRGIALQREDDIQARSLNCRGESEDDTGGNRDEQSECEYAIVEAKLERGERCRLKL